MKARTLIEIPIQDDTEILRFTFDEGLLLFNTRNEILFDTMKPEDFVNGINRMIKLGWIVVE
jgi:hypothetical protein